MTIGSIGGTSSLNPLYAAQAASSCNAPAQVLSDSNTTPGSSGTNALTGSTTASLDSQTLQALMNLTQQDPANGNDPASVSQNGQNGQTQAHHHHHHHHGGGGGVQSTDPSSPSANTASTASTTDAFGVASAESADDTTETSLTQALLSA